MSRNGKPETGARRTAAEIPVLTEVVDAAAAAGISTAAQVDEFVAQIERVVLEELTPRLEDAVHEAVRAAVDRAIAAKRKPQSP
jgi:hypothetical protein